MEREVTMVEIKTPSRVDLAFLTTIPMIPCSEYISCCTAYELGLSKVDMQRMSLTLLPCFEGCHTACFDLAALAINSGASFETLNPSTQ